MWGERNMPNTIKQSSQNNQSARTLKATMGLQIFNKLTLKKTSVPGMKARRSVYKTKANQHTLGGQNQQSKPSLVTAKHLLQDSTSLAPIPFKRNERVWQQIRHFKEGKYTCSVNNVFRWEISNIMKIFLPDAGAEWRSQLLAGRARRRGPPSPGWQILMGNFVQLPSLQRQPTSTPGRVVPPRLWSEGDKTKNNYDTGLINYIFF